MQLFRLDASIFPASSASRELGDLVEAQWLATHPGGVIARRDIGTDPVASTMWANAVSAGMTPDDQRTPAQVEAAALARTFADELLGADALLFTVPLYNYGVSQHFKTWFDLAYTVPEIGPTGDALAGKPAVLATTLGGNYAEGTPREGWDHSTEWLRRVLGDVWKLDLHVVQRPFTLVGVNPALDQFADVGAELKANAESAARRAGESIAERARVAA